MSLKYTTHDSENKIEKYWKRKKDYLLRDGTTHFAPQEYAKLHFNDEGKWSVTAACLGKIMDDVIASLPGLPPKITVTDGTASCGGNVMSFMCHPRYGCVNAVEIDPDTFKMLVSNFKYTKLYRYHSANVTPIRESYLNVMHTLWQQVVFLDPPWGGVGSNSTDGHPVDLTLGGKSLVDIVNDLYINRHVSGTQYVVLKVFRRFDTQKFNKHLQRGITWSLLQDRLTQEHKKLFSFPVLICSFHPTNPPTNQSNLRVRQPNQYSVKLSPATELSH